MHEMLVEKQEDLLLCIYLIFVNSRTIKFLEEKEKKKKKTVSVLGIGCKHVQWA